MRAMFKRTQAIKAYFFIVCIYVEVSCSVTDHAQKYGGPYWDKGWSELGSRVLNLDHFGKKKIVNISVLSDFRLFIFMLYVLQIV